MTFPLQSKERLDLQAECAANIAQLSPDELRVVRFITGRMIRIGHGKYGPLDLSMDGRSWKRERSEETSDRIFYDSCAELAEEARRMERVSCFRHDEAFAKVEPGLAELAAFDVSDGGAE